MKRLFLVSFVACIGLFSCQREEIACGDYENRGKSIEFYATIEDGDLTKTTLDDHNNVRWSENDQIVIFGKSTIPSKYQIKQSYVGKTYGSFLSVSSGSSEGDFDGGLELSHNIAYYPYSEVVECEKFSSNYKLYIYLPTEQIYAEDSFGNGTFPMVAVSETEDLAFRNVCGGMKLQLKGTCKVASITVEGKNGEKLSGNASVIAYTDGSKPAITMADYSSTSATLNCGAGVQLNETTATEFIISLPPTTFTKGFKVTVTDNDGGTQVIETSKNNEVLRSSLLVMPALTVKTESQGNVLSTDGTANCYIISEAGSYKFTPTKGNSSESVGAIASAEVLWETFGTNVTPSVGDLVKNATYKNGVISFETPSTFKEGNAVIAAKDASGKILWSWHIWLTDQPEGQVYYNNAGTMMDRNLGATSATPGDVGALGLLYQWGRRDPFLGSSALGGSSSSIEKPTLDISYLGRAAVEKPNLGDPSSEETTDEVTEAKSTITWPSAVLSDASCGTIAYATANPTAFIKNATNNFDWCYTNTPGRWTTSSSNKSIYDPCPAGWRVPSNGIWSKALGSSSKPEFDSTNKGMDFSGKFGADYTVWYPAPGYITGGAGTIRDVGKCGHYWSASLASVGTRAYILNFNSSNNLNFSDINHCAYGMPVRCVKE